MELVGGLALFIGLCFVVYFVMKVTDTAVDIAVDSVVEGLFVLLKRTFSKQDGQGSGNPRVGGHATDLARHSEQSAIRTTEQTVPVVPTTRLQRPINATLEPSASPNVEAARHSSSDSTVPVAQNSQGAGSHHPPAEPEPSALLVGGSAKVVSADRRFAGRVGQIMSIKGQTVDLKLRGTVGNLSFRIKDLIALSEPRTETQRTGTALEGGLAPGGLAKIVSGDSRFDGRVGRVVSIDRSLVTLKIDGSFGTFDFRISDVTTM